MTYQVNSIPNFGFRNFINLLQIMITNIKVGVSSAFYESIILEIEKSEQELLSFYHYLASAENQDLLKYDFYNILETIEDGSDKIEKLLNTLKLKEDKSINEQNFYKSMDSFYTTLVQCKIEISFITAELDFEKNRVS